MLQRLLLMLFLVFMSACNQNKISEFGPLKLGLIAPFQPGDPTAHPFKKIPVSKFYIYVVEKNLLPMCVFEDCGPHGNIVRCLGGWLSGDAQPEIAESFGLNETEVERGETSIVVVADQESKIVGIYPNHTMKNIPSILKQHSDLLDFGSFNLKCATSDDSALIPG